MEIPVVERIVVPAGVKMRLSGYYDDVFHNPSENTVFFFEDAEENVEKTFYLPGEETDNPEACFVKGAYYAGEWR